MELPARLWDHVTHKTVRCFNLLGIGWTNGDLFLMVAFSMMSSANAASRLVEMDDSIDHDTPGWKARMDAIKQKPELAIEMIKEILEADIPATHVLCDSWFTTAPFIAAVKETGPELIGMIKLGTQQYIYKGVALNVRQLAQFVDFRGGGNIFGSLSVKTRLGTQVRLVFVRNRNKKNEYVVILTTDLTLTDAEVIETCSLRWCIEVCFKCCKSYLNLEQENQGRSYDRTVAMTAIGLIRFNLLEYTRFAHCQDITFKAMEDMIHEREDELEYAMNGLIKIFDDPCLEELVGAPESAGAGTGANQNANFGFGQGIDLNATLGSDPTATLGPARDIDPSIAKIAIAYSLCLSKSVLKWYSQLPPGLQAQWAASMANIEKMADFLAVGAS